MKTFKEFVDKKSREAKKQLEMVKKILTQEGMQVSDFLEEEDPYIYLRNPQGNLSFDGLRIYKIGSNIAYRVQKEEKTHPYGQAYNLDIEGIFQDIITEPDANEQKAGEEVIQAVTKELKGFFSKSGEAERDLQSSEFDTRNDSSGKTVMGGTGTDYANTVTGNNRTYSPF